MRRARQRLKEGHWAEAAERVRKLRHMGRPSKRWRKTFDDFEADCWQAAANLALDEGDYEEALEHALKAAHLRGKEGLEVRAGIQAAMLAEVRRLFAIKHTSDTSDITDLIARTMLIQSPCREASFWQALCDVRNGHSDQALVNLQIARTGQALALALDEGIGDIAAPGAAPPPTSPFIDPPLYLGAILLMRGQPKEAMRFLTEANRMDPGCPVVTMQLGAAMIAAGGDTQFAVRALQKALGPRGLGQWEGNPQRAWVEGFPEHRSYVRKLASEYPYTCPLWGGDLILLIRQGNMALRRGSSSSAITRMRRRCTTAPSRKERCSCRCCAGWACRSPSWAASTMRSSTCAPRTRWSRPRTASPRAISRCAALAASRRVRKTAGKTSRGR